MLDRVDLVRVNNRILDDAGSLSPAELRSLDAIHIATVGRVVADISAVVTYDDRFANAAKAMGWRVAAPA